MKVQLLIMSLLFSSVSYAGVLSQPEIFYRCYAHLTNQRVRSTHQLLKRVKSGSITGVDACLSVLNKALLTSSGVIKNKSDDEAKSVIKTMTKAHVAFFERRAVLGVNSGFIYAENDLYDEQGTGLFYTKALLTPNFDLSKILKEDGKADGFRLEGVPSKGYSSNEGTGSFPFDRVNFVETGDLIGVKSNRVLSFPAAKGAKASGRDILSSIGGGILGAKSYLKKNLLISNLKKDFNGTTVMNRKWSQAVLKDFLCKSLPAVRTSDGSPYVRKNAEAVFRKSEGCIRCHATMDQLAAGGRGLRMGTSYDGKDFRYPYDMDKTKGDAAVWPLQADSNYSKRPPKGVLYFRSYTGDLVREAFSNFSDLGQKMSETDDFYTCIAKKYYHYFTGVSVSLADINDPFSSVQLDEQDLLHRKKVISLGEQLKSTKSTYGLVKEILKSQVYQDEGYTIVGGR